MAENKDGEEGVGGLRRKEEHEIVAPGSDRGDCLGWVLADRAGQF